MRRRPRTRLPQPVETALRLSDKERVLAWATGPSGEWYVGTNLAIHLPTADGGYGRLPWEDVERADWSSDSDHLAVVEVADWGAANRSTVLPVTEPGNLLELIRERVTNSVVCTRYARVRGAAGLSVVGRRSSSPGEGVRWSYVLSAGLNPGDPDVASVASQTLAEARREVEGL